MDTYYDVTLHEKKVGAITLKRQGAYYLLECLCDVPMNQKYELKFQCDSNRHGLGLCVPYGNQMGVKSRIKVSMIYDRNPVFYLMQTDTDVNERFTTVITGSTFENVHLLTVGYYVIRKGERGIIFPIKG